MEQIEGILKNEVKTLFATQFATELDSQQIAVSITKKEFEGDYTLVTFPFIKFTKKSPEQTGELVGQFLVEKRKEIKSFNVVKGFLNLVMTDEYWLIKLAEIQQHETFYKIEPQAAKVVLEYCGPNTNKPLHIGHIRNMLLGFSMGEILKENGYPLTKVNINNDRGIAICKSMAAYILYGMGETPESSGVKGDHFVGDFYVKFNEVAKQEMVAIPNLPADKDEAIKQTAIFKLAHELLLKWEAGEPDTIALWAKMNGWVYDGFKETFDTLGIDFQKEYYESETYKLGKNIIEEGLAKGVFFKRNDGAIAIDLTAEGLDEKVVLRADGTSIYITQDIGTADQRHQEFDMDKMIYVVANEQDYHFQVLKIILQKMGYAWADGIYHLSYGMVESPTGRFKSREGNTADADDLIKDVLQIATDKTRELGKTEGFSEEEVQKLYSTIGLGALKYFILRVNPFKKMIFNPEESIDFQGHTGSFIQFSHARLRSIIRRASSPNNPQKTSLTLHATERELVLQMRNYHSVLKAAAANYDPSEVANFVYILAKLCNKFLTECPVLTAATEDEKQFRIALCLEVAFMLKKCMKLLGIEVPEKM